MNYIQEWEKFIKKPTNFESKEDKLFRTILRNQVDCKKRQFKVHDKI